ncbi:MAG: TolC family protein [bacterium]
MKAPKILFIVVVLLICAQVTVADELIKLSLSQCIELGVTNNLSLKKANYDVLSAEESALRARSMYEPSVSASGGRTDARSPITTPTFGDWIRTDSLSLGINKKIDYLGGLLSLGWENEKSDAHTSLTGIDPSYESIMSAAYSQPLVNNALGSNDRKAIRLADLGESVARLSLNSQRNILINTIENAYAELDFAKKNLGVQKAFLERAKKLLAVNKQKLKDGIIEEVDVIATEAAVTLREASILLAEDAAKNSKDALINLIGLSYDDKYEFADMGSQEGFTHMEVVEQDMITRALARRPDIAILEQSIRVAELSMNIAKNEKMPVLDLDARYSLSGYGDDWDADYKSLEPSWYLGLSLTFFPLSKYSGSTFRASEYAYSRTRAEFEEKRLAVVTEAKALTRKVNTQALYVQASMKARELQKRKLKLEEDKFNQGRSSIQWLLNFQDDLSNSEVQVHRALTDYHRAQSDLKLVTGDTR